MDADADGEKESPDKDKNIGAGVVRERKSLTEVNELKVNASNQIEKHGGTSGVHGRVGLQVQQQQQPQGTVVCWERFLHVRSIWVLLVENDDSTRHVVTALLRNCNYEVLVAANGVQAWKILEDLNNHIDIVLTEVAMPGLSGIGLLLKIMSHNIRKNIPVIMMSPIDSMGLVFKCLSKGAVDFLVKPIRKNELKNLWQHVWRRCHSSSGSGSESGTQTQKSVKSKGSEKPCNSASDGGENDGSNGLNVGDASDDGSGAQSSWTKQAVEADNSHDLSHMNQVADCQDSTCAQVIRSNAENSDNKNVQISVDTKGYRRKHSDNVEKGKDLDTIDHRDVKSKSENFVETQHDLISRECESAGKVANVLDINNTATDDSKEPNCELSLKRVRGDQDSVRSVPDDRFVLRRSEQSAFSRYNSPTNILKAPTGIISNSSINDNSIEVAKRESIGYSSEPILCQSLNGVGNNMDMGSTTNRLPKDRSEASASNCLQSSAFKTDIKYSQQDINFLPNGIPSTGLVPLRGSHKELQIQHPHHQNYCHRPHNQYQRENQPSSSSLEKLSVDAPHCGSTNVFDGPTDVNIGNSSLNRSASGSNHGSTGQNGSSTAVNNGVNNAESDGGQVGKSGNGDASGSGCGNRGDENRLAQRKAALIKFRQKRKERCFKKKVRYENRQKIAEQRPRVRGQFVKQTGPDGASRNEDE
ncbi:two-component response regulator-like APRR7 isoform X2 [Andrographis paniculata]|uniref:two-component response regulator-like APRR7 isoform X2 n=1 Tax=Andrographis paniculata TaxID=175694 RepID=UPI0021E82689|nr:two-component response regulator-like APRR7 isoform X2 [Andrographis paniculata]